MLKSFNEFCTPLLTNRVSEAFDDQSSQTLDEFYQTLKSFADSGETISISNYSRPVHSKVLKNIQIGLVYLGYQLPESETNGSLGPRTLAAISHFKKSEGKDLPKEKVKNYVNDPTLKLKAVDFGNSYDNY